jgi:hypothetical protein
MLPEASGIQVKGAIKCPIEPLGSSSGAGRLPERRRAPRIPVGIPATVAHGRLAAAGTVLDASVTGLLIELSEPLPFVESDVVVSLALPEAGRRDLEAAVVRRAVGRDGRVLLAVRLTEPRPAPRPERRSAPQGPAPPKRRIRGRTSAPAAAAAPRPRAMALAELRAVGTRAYELALDDPSAPAPAPLVDWAARLAEELGVRPAPARPRMARDLVAALSELSRLAREAPEDPPT